MKINKTSNGNFNMPVKHKLETTGTNRMENI